ncbi:hypothetical protein [Paraburkholderia ferrariae]|uniref:hypothetical protein n=1 Tax=Paraburkholderia ferrariae TaxID=386056 RepID=UPI0012EB72BB|nr:hypothetical protein [Paraburkholderia ferrariae]
MFDVHGDWALWFGFGWDRGLDPATQGVRAIRRIVSNPFAVAPAGRQRIGAAALVFLLASAHLNFGALRTKNVIDYILVPLFDVTF